MTCNPDAQCDIACSGPNSCSIGTNAFNPNETITPMTCPQNGNCQVNCTGDNSCIAANVTCPTQDGFECNIKCSATNSCQDMIINAKDATGTVTVDCSGDNSCSNITSICSSGQEDCVAIKRMLDHCHL